MKASPLWEPAPLDPQSLQLWGWGAQILQGSHWEGEEAGPLILYPLVPGSLYSIFWGHSVL